MNTVVYYPHIFPSPDWLKMAAICWNKVYRFVPAHWSYDSVDDPGGVNKLDQELGGVLFPINTQEIAIAKGQGIPVNEINERFIHWIEANRGRLDRERRQQPYLLQQREVPFYVGKVTNDVYHFLQQEGFRQEGPFLYLPDYIAHYYLSLCASRAVQLYKSDSVTDEQKFTDIIFDSSPLVAEVATAVIKAYVPVNLIILEPSRIKDLRSALSTEKLKFQAKIHSLVDDYGKISSVGEFETIKREIVGIAREQIEDIKKTFKQSNQRLVLKAFTLSLTPPALATSIASLLGLGIVAPVGIAAALALFSASAIIDWKEAKSKKDESPWSYIFKIEQMK